MSDKKKVFVIGSVSQLEDLKMVADVYTDLGFDVAYPIKEGDIPFDILVKQAYMNINKADLIVVVPKRNGSFGEGTTYECAFAECVLKPIVVYHFNTWPIVEDTKKPVAYPYPNN